MYIIYIYTYYLNPPVMINKKGPNRRVNTAQVVQKQQPNHCVADIFIQPKCTSIFQSLSRVPKSKTPEVQLTTWIIMVSLYVTHNTPNKQLASAWNFPKKTPEGRGISHTNSSTGLDLLLCRIGSAICTNQLGYPLVMSK